MPDVTMKYVLRWDRSAESADMKCVLRYVGYDGCETFVMYVCMYVCMCFLFCRKLYVMMSYV